MTATPANATITDAEFNRFRDFFYRRTGIHFADSKRFFVDKRIAACLAESGEETFASWFSQIRLTGDDALFESALSRMTIHETYFLREDYQLTGLIDDVLPAVMERRATNAPVRILSLPCSTGDEAYSIAISLLERWPDIDDVDVEIVAADIDAKSVRAAKDGVYGKRALQKVSAAQRGRWFQTLGDGRHRISEALRGAIDFRVANICDPQSMRRLGSFDIVFCRNLLIYFDERSSRRAAECLYDALIPGGYLLLGHSESMSRITSIFQPVRLDETAAYQRPTGAPR